MVSVRDNISLGGGRRSSQYQGQTLGGCGDQYQGRHFCKVGEGVVVSIRDNTSVGGEKV